MVGTRIAPDNNDTVIWKFDDASAPFVNSSTSPSAPSHAISDLTNLSGTVLRQQPSLFAASGTNSCVTFIGNNNGSPRNFIDGPFGNGSVYEPVFPITFSCWIFLRSYGNTGFVQHVFNKQDTNNVWSGPFGSFTMQNQSTGSSTYNIGLATAGAQGTTTFWTMYLNNWCHMGITYDGSTMTNYLNGNIVSQRTASGAINYGGHGPWFFGAIPGGSGNPEETPVSICDFRIANIARNQAYFQNIYQNGILNGGSSISVFTTFYKMRAYDIAFTTQAFYWVDTTVSYNNAPASTSGVGLGPIEVIETWNLVNT